MSDEISKQGARRAAQYREQGEPPVVLAVEDCLTARWQSTTAITEQARRSRHYVTLALEYLYSEGRADRRRSELGAANWRWEWRRTGPHPD